MEERTGPPRLQPTRRTRSPLARTSTAFPLTTCRARVPAAVTARSNGTVQISASRPHCSKRPLHLLHLDHRHPGHPASAVAPGLRVRPSVSTSNARPRTLTAVSSECSGCTISSTTSTVPGAFCCGQYAMLRRIFGVRDNGSTAVTSVAFGTGPSCCSRSPVRAGGRSCRGLMASHLTEVPNGFRVLIPHSKGGQERQGQEIAVVGDKKACPVSALKSGLEAPSIHRWAAVPQAAPGRSRHRGPYRSQNHRDGRQALRRPGRARSRRLRRAQPTLGLRHLGRRQRGHLVPADGPSPAPLRGNCPSVRRAGLFEDRSGAGLL